MQKIISLEKSIIVAADVPSLYDLARLVKAVEGVPGISAVKLGFILAMKGLGTAVRIVKEAMGPDFPVIYDHQKAGNDIPEMGRPFAEALKEAGVDAAILFPFTGPVTQEAWTRSCFEAGLKVLTGGVMTHPKFLKSEGGSIDDDAVEKIYLLACTLGVRHFVVPGNKIAWVKRVHAVLVSELGDDNFVLYAPGFISQKGDISECGAAAGNHWHAIVGSAIYKDPFSGGMRTVAAMREAAFAVTRQIVPVSA